MVRLTDELQPRFVLFENVRGLVTAVGPSGQPGEALELLRREFEGIGYATTFATVNAADYGASQRRVRLLMLATADHELPTFPDPTHGRADKILLDGDRKPWVTLGELLAGLPEPDPSDVVRPTPRRAEELEALAPGTGIRTGGVIESNRPGGHWGYRQDCFLADPSLPSRTIRAASTPDWIRLSDGSLRRLTWRECAALQGFPMEWQFAGTSASRFRQIGNAVQADVAQAVGEHLLGYLYSGPTRVAPTSAPWPPEFGRRVRYTVAEHRTNGAHRRRVRASV
jgi:DNA (cytosine-5)-methyltransferase 1